MLHYVQQVFGNVFEGRESKCCPVLMKHCHKIKGEQVITLQMSQQLKTKNINVVPGQLFSCQCKAKFLLETGSLYWWSRQISICYRYWQLIHWTSNPKEKAPINCHFTCQLTHIYENFKEQFSEAYKVQVDCLKDWGSDSYDKWYERESKWLG